jgi:hypothetical protein
MQGIRADWPNRDFANHKPFPGQIGMGQNPEYDVPDPGLRDRENPTLLLAKRGCSAHAHNRPGPRGLGASESPIIGDWAARPRPHAPICRNRGPDPVFPESGTRRPRFPSWGVYALSGHGSSGAP